MNEIPNSAELIATGLYVHRYTATIGGTEYNFAELYSAEGYCFYDNTAAVYDNEGNVIPPENVLPEQRLYAQWCALSIFEVALTNEQLAAKYISVPVDDSYEIVSAQNNE